MANDPMRKTPLNHDKIVTKGKIKAMVGGVSEFFKGIKKGTETKVGKNGVGGSYNESMTGGK